MLELVTVFMRLFILITLKVSEWLIFYLVSQLYAFILFLLHPLLFIAKCTCNIIASFVWNTKRAGRVKEASKKHTVGVVILSRFPVPERASINDKHVDDLHASLRNPGLLERVLSEFVVSCLLSWIGDNNRGTSQWLLHSCNFSLILVYKKNYTGAHSLTKWFDVLPDHQVAKSTMNRKIANAESVSFGTRVSEITAAALHNANHRRNWEDPGIYCSVRKISHRRNLGRSSLPHLAKKLLAECQYITVESLEHSQLLEVGLRAALRSKCDYIIVLNPRAIGLRPDHLTSTLQLLINHEKSRQIDAVLGITQNYETSSHCMFDSSEPHELTLDSIKRPQSRSNQPAGLYLLGLRGDRRLILNAKSLSSNVEWSAASTASTLLANFNQMSPKWNVVCLLERLQQINQIKDLLSLENLVGLPCEHLLDDSISVIIPIGPGHVDDSLDIDEDAELVDLNTSKALLTTLELVVHNASGKRRIEIIIINSDKPTEKETGSHLSVNFRDGDRFHGIRLRSMITINVRYFDRTAVEYIDPNSTYPKRGTLIRYAVDNFAKGSMIVFVEPGIQLPVNWDSAIYHTLQRPGIGMGCFAYRLHLHEKYIHRKSLVWAINCLLANWAVNVQTHWSEVPIVGQPYFIYSHYLACLGGYPRSSRALHPIDLAMLCHQRVGSVALTRTRTASAGVPADFALRHGAYRTALYTSLIALGRYMGATEAELGQALTCTWRGPSKTDTQSKHYRLPLIQPHYLDGY